MVRLGPTTDGEVKVHEPTPACERVHCYSCGVDEPFDDGDYRLCFECGHVYRDGAELVRAYRRAAWNLLDRHHPWLRGNEFYPSVVESLWKIATIRAKNIGFCQECLHDW